MVKNKRESEPAVKMPSIASKVTRGDRPPVFVSALPEINPYHWHKLVACSSCTFFGHHISKIWNLFRRCILRHIVRAFGSWAIVFIAIVYKAFKRVLSRRQLFKSSSTGGRHERYSHPLDEDFKKVATYSQMYLTARLKAYIMRMTKKPNFRRIHLQINFQIFGCDILSLFCGKGIRVLI